VSEEKHTSAIQRTKITICPNSSYSLQSCANLWIATPMISLVTGEAVFMDVQHLQNVG